MSLVRINPLNDSSVDNSVLIFQICLTIYMMFAALFVAHTIGLDAYTHVIRNFCFIVAGWLLLNISYVLNPFSHSGFGDFNKDSYQQVGLIFGLCLIFSAIWLKESIRSKSKNAIFHTFLFLLLLILLLINPARGEMIAAVVSVALVLAPRISVIICLFIFINPQVISDLANATEFSSISRLAYFVQSDSGDSPRFQIFSQAFELLASNPTLILFGGGANHFQASLGTSHGTHPHNIFVETLISGGVIWTVVTIFIFLLPVLRTAMRQILKYPIQELPFALALFTLVVLSKSGTINSAIVPVLFTPYFVQLRKMRTHKGFK